MSENLPFPGLKPYQLNHTKFNRPPVTTDVINLGITHTSAIIGERE